MLNGLAPILIFQFSKLTPETETSISKIPIVSSIVSKIGLPPIPIYLDEKLTGVYIDQEDKTIDIDTTADSETQVNQKTLGSSVKITMKASKESIGLTLLSAMADLIVPKVNNQEYSLTYLNGAITVFDGLLNSFSITQNAENDLYNITLEISKKSDKTIKKSDVPEPTAATESVQLSSVGGGASTPTGATTPLLQGPVTPAVSAPAVKIVPAAAVGMRLL